MDSIKSSIVSEAQHFDSTQLAKLRAMHDFKQLGKTLDAQESKLIDQMLEDYKQSREQMYNLAKKLALIDSDSHLRGEVALVTLAAPESNSTSER